MYDVDQDLVDEARRRIDDVRRQKIVLELGFPQTASIQGAQITVDFHRHAFRFGCNAFDLFREEDPGLRHAYGERLTDLMNYVTLPFYWRRYEPEPDAPEHEALRRTAEWCQQHDLTIKGHPLMWHEPYPDWAEDMPDEQVRGRQRQRVREIVARFRGLIDTWDIVNEATVSARFDNAIGRWIDEEGAATVVAEMLALAREANPDAELLYNDFNIRDEAFGSLVQALQARGAPLDALGLQSHMHKGVWPLQEAWALCERHARFGLPLHFTELTVLSGRLKPEDEEDWHRVHTDWDSTPEGEEAQADYGEALYTVLYSHPAVEAITWWDLSDRHAWQGAPAGLVREDMSPKPLYERLMHLIHDEWSTHARITLSDSPEVALRCVAGEYAITAMLPNKMRMRGHVTVPLGYEGHIPVKLQ